MSWRRTALVSVAAASSAYAVISALMARGLTRNQRIPVLDVPSAVGLEYESITFPSRVDHLPLSGWVMRPHWDAPMAADRWVVVVHGHGSHRADPGVGILPLVRGLVKSGYSALVFDLRGCGISPGENASAGHFEQRDLLGALDYLRRNGVSSMQTAVIGFSVGAVIALLVCSRPGHAEAVIADSPFADLSQMIERGTTGWLTPLRIFHPGMRFMARCLYGIDIRAVSPITALRDSDLPVFLIHGDADEMVPVTQFRLLARLLENEKSESWQVPKAGHLQAFRQQPEVYTRRVIQFLERTLAEPEQVRPASSLAKSSGWETS